MANSSASGFVQTISLGLAIAIVVFTTRIYNATKPEKNPIERYEESLPNSLSALSPNKGSLNESKYCQCGKEVLNNICTEEQIISGCYDITPNDKKNLLRNLVDQTFCNEVIQERNSGKNFSQIFSLNYNMVNKMALGILIIYCCILGVIALLIISLICLCVSQEGGLCCLVTCLPIILIVVIGSGIADLVLFIIMLVNFYKGKTTGDFIEFMNGCQHSEGTSYNSVVDELRTINGYMTAFVALNSIGIFFNYLGAILNKKSSSEE